VLTLAGVFGAVVASPQAASRATVATAIRGSGSGITARSQHGDGSKGDIAGHVFILEERNGCDRWMDLPWRRALTCATDAIARNPTLSSGNHHFGHRGIIDPISRPLHR
jgi:hypothetical protein